MDFGKLPASSLAWLNPKKCGHQCPAGMAHSSVGKHILEVGEKLTWKKVKEFYLSVKIVMSAVELYGASSLTLLVALILVVRGFVFSFLCVSWVTAYLQGIVLYRVAVQAEQRQLRTEESVRLLSIWRSLEIKRKNSKCKSWSRQRNFPGVYVRHRLLGEGMPLIRPAGIAEVEGRMSELLSMNKCQRIFYQNCSLEAGIHCRLPFGFGVSGAFLHLPYISHS